MVKVYQTLSIYSVKLIEQLIEICKISKYWVRIRLNRYEYL